jgi:hypothetical protein
MLTIGMINSKVVTYILLFQFSFFSEHIIFCNLVLLKGLYVENKKLYLSVFLFGRILKSLIKTLNFQELTLQRGKLSYKL